mgnify:CR=1 FL=1
MPDPQKIRILIEWAFREYRQLWPMTDPFELEIDYKNEKFVFPAQLQVAGYSVKIEVLVNDQAWYFERDEEGQFRAVLPYGVMPDTIKNIDRNLLRAIAEKINEILA